MYRTAIAAALLVPSVASAGAPDLSTAFMGDSTYVVNLIDEPASSGEGLETVPGKKKRGFDMEVNFRGRYLTMPGSILDIWYFNEKDDGWLLPGEDRPKIRGYGLGVEFVIKSKPKETGVGGANGLFYVDWAASLMKTGYFDDVEEPPEHMDGDYIEPTKSLGLLIIGANYAYEIHMVKTSQTNGNFGLSMLVGGGLGAAIRVGQLKRWGPSEDGTKSGPERFRDGEEPDGNKRVPPALPMVDVNLGLRFNIADRMVFRLEGGLHDLIYGGAALGIMF